MAPTRKAPSAAALQVRSHHSVPGLRRATTAAARAAVPISTPPQPGTAVNAVADSIVSRMNCRFSMAWASSPAGRRERDRTGFAQAILGSVCLYFDYVKYFVKQSNATAGSLL